MHERYKNEAFFARADQKKRDIFNQGITSRKKHSRAATGTLYLLCAAALIHGGGAVGMKKTISFPIQFWWRPRSSDVLHLLFFLVTRPI